MANHAQEITLEGYAVVRGVLDAQACQTLNAAIDACRAAPGPTHRVLSAPGAPVFESELFRWPDIGPIRDLATTGPLPDLARAVFGTDTVILMEDQWFYSEAGSGARSPWHQDHPYHPLEPWFLTIWLALDDPPGPVGLAVAPRSHGGTLYGPVEFSAGTKTLADGAIALEPVPDIDGAPESWGAVRPPVGRGDAILLDSRTLHAAGGRCSGRFRRLSIRYAHPVTRITPRAWPVAEFWDSHTLTPGAPLARPAFPALPLA